MRLSVSLGQKHLVAPRIPTTPWRPTAVKLDLWQIGKIRLDHFEYALGLNRMFGACATKDRCELLAHCRCRYAALGADKQKLMLIAKPISGADVNLVPNQMCFVL